MLLDFVKINDGVNDWLSVSYFGSDNQKHIINLDLSHDLWEWSSKMPEDKRYNTPVMGYKSWDGKTVYRMPVKSLTRTRQYDIIETRCDEELKKEIFCKSKPKITFCDIETEVIDGFPEPSVAKERITCIGTSCDSEIIVRGIKPLKKHDIDKIGEEVKQHFGEDRWTFEYRYYTSEHEMLMDFLTEVKQMDVLTGWNFTGFDWYYITTRCKRLGIDTKMASPISVVLSGNKDNPETPYHVFICDYMVIYKGNQKKAPSYKLDMIGDIVCGIKKVEYDGTLQQLYENDFHKYIYYNAIDCGLVQKIHEKSKALDIAMLTCQTTNTKLPSVTSKTAITENYLRHAMLADKIVITKETKKECEKEGYEGAYVAEPEKGLHRMVMCCDFASLYPTCVRMYNIGMETLVGKFHENTTQLESFKSDHEHYIVTPNNTVYKKKDGYFKKEVSRLFKERKQNKKWSWVCKQTSYELGKLLDADAPQSEIEEYLKKHIDDINLIMKL